MMKIRLLLFGSLLLSQVGCVTDANLPHSSHLVVKPRAKTKNKARLYFGNARTPDMAGTLEAVPASKENDRLLNRTTKEGGDSELILPLIAFDYYLFKSFAGGFSTTRGLYGIFDVYERSSWVLSLSPSVGNYKQTSSLKRTEEDDNESVEIDESFKAESHSVNVSLIGSYEHKLTRFTSLIPYVTLGLTHSEDKIEGRYRSAARDFITPNVNFGLSLDSTYTSLNWEYGFIPVKERDQPSQIRTSQALSIEIGVPF